MILKTKKWLLLPFCLLFGLILLVTFVFLSQNYLSEYLVRNSKSRIGHKIELKALSNYLNEPKIAFFANSHGQSKIILSFWSMTCAPCLSKLSKLSDQGPESIVLPINTDPIDKIAEAEAIQLSLAPQTRFLHDKDGLLVKQIEIDYLPTNVHLNREGIIEKIEIGER